MDDLTPRHIEELEKVNETFVDKNRDKFIAGVREHGGYLSDMKPQELMKNLDEEILDAWNYSYFVKRQIYKLLAEIESLRVELANKDAYIKEFLEPLEK